jgi:predicted DNA-binding transcriptional regulator AlpA
MLYESNETSTVTSRQGAEPLTEIEAAGRLGLKVATLRAWRHQGRGPAFLRLGRAIRYLSSDLDEFVQANRHRPTTDSID